MGEVVSHFRLMLLSKHTDFPIPNYVHSHKDARTGEEWAYASLVTVESTGFLGYQKIAQEDTRI